MSLLFKHLRVHQIFGANTDVGKTVFATALSIASKNAGHQVFYLKPVSTGAPEDADDLKIRRFAQSGVNADCLFRFSEPVSPYLAVRMEGVSPNTLPTDKTFVNAISSHIKTCAGTTTKASHMYVETAGGVHSPTLLGTSQADCYRPLFLPTILVGDSKLGGISSTISAYESLVLRGYIIDSILLFKDPYYLNHEYLVPYFAERNVVVHAVDPPPSLTGNAAEDERTTAEYYASIASTHGSSVLSQAISSLDSAHAKRIEELESMPSRSLQSIWWPFVQHGAISGPSEITPIDSAHSDFFSIYKPGDASSSSVLSPQLDGSSSWWTQAVGHANPRLTLAAARAAGRYGHVMFPKNAHLPALKLAETLVAGPGRDWASRAFFSDNGSTGMEVAIKMALRDYGVRSGSWTQHRKKSLGIIGLKGSYHGDTMGAMDACEEGVYTCEWHNAKGFWFDPPTVGKKADKVTITQPSALGGDSVVFEHLQEAYDVSKRMDSELATRYREYIHTTLSKLAENKTHDLAALVLEPLVMGAGGMIFVDPLFQRILIDTVRLPTGLSPFPVRLPVIFDEVFVGLHRLGMESTSPLLGTTPDISCHAKILTGGLLPLAITLTSERVFQAFNSTDKADALLHGHSYTAHPIGCEVANETLAIIGELKESKNWKDAQGRWTPEKKWSFFDEVNGTTAPPPTVWSLWDPGFVGELSKMDSVEEVMALGTVFVVKLKATDAGYLSNLAESTFLPLREATTTNPGDLGSVAPGRAPYSVHFRTLGNVAYFMTSLNTEAEVIRDLEDRIWGVLTSSRT
ncbi:PLP-dependent transferase [Pterulicium gracile]|uniref:PLP-dependent transferase n=1 Tax=Pterulicium gracile TaxID=1884261 RepID=A0A5C3Q9J4_9AGAR|nr:PLP-dependent transferase [Pterula gracilis]